jgi:hypothetical protein
MVGTSASARTVIPRDLNVDGHFTGIIDIYDEDDRVSLEDARNLGVRAVMHETGMGLYKKVAPTPDGNKRPIEWMSYGALFIC